MSYKKVKALVNQQKIALLGAMKLAQKHDNVVVMVECSRVFLSLVEVEKDLSSFRREELFFLSKMSECSKKQDTIGVLECSTRLFGFAKAYDTILENTPASTLIH